MADDKKTLKFQMMMSPAEAEVLDDWMFKNRVRSRAEAIRRLCQMGIIYDREVKPAVEMITNHIVDSNFGKKPPLSRSEHQRLFESMAISLFNAHTVAAKLENPSTDDAIKSLMDLYEYYASDEAQRISEQVKRIRESKNSPSPDPDAASE